MSDPAPVGGQSAEHASAFDAVGALRASTYDVRGNGPGLPGLFTGVATTLLRVARHVLPRGRRGRRGDDGTSAPRHDQPHCRRCRARNDGGGEHLVHGQDVGRAPQPGVSIAFALRGDFPWRRVRGYIVVNAAAPCSPRICPPSCRRSLRDLRREFRTSGISDSAALWMERPKKIAATQCRYVDASARTESSLRRVKAAIRAPLLTAASPDHRSRCRRCAGGETRRCTGLFPVGCVGSATNARGQLEAVTKPLTAVTEPAAGTQVLEDSAVRISHRPQTEVTREHS